MKGFSSFVGGAIIFLILASSVTDGSIDPGGIANNAIGVLMRMANAGMEEVTENLPGGN